MIQAEPLAHLWEVLSYPVQFQPTLGLDLNFTSESQRVIFFYNTTYLATIICYTSSIPLRSAEIHRTEFSST